MELIQNIEAGLVEREITRRNNRMAILQDGADSIRTPRLLRYHGPDLAHRSPSFSEIAKFWALEKRCRVV